MPLGILTSRLARSMAAAMTATLAVAGCLDLADPALEGAGGSIAEAECVPAPEGCDGLDNDCDGVADDGVADCDVCAPHNELPVVTHWDGALGAPRYLAADQADVFAGYPGGEYVAGNCYPFYAGGRMPDLDQYVGDTWSVSAIPDDEANALIEGLCHSTGLPFRLLRPDAVGTPRLASRAGAVQVVHGLVVDGSMVTVVLPASWAQGAPANSYPIVANGFYDLNEATFRAGGPELMRMIGLSSTDGRSGAIGVLWNGGGALASRTLSQRALDQFAQVIDLVAGRFSGDRHRILMYGGSRGGVTALAMASNTRGYDYTVTFAAAGVPPTRLGEHSLLQSATFPALLEAVSWTTGLGDAWRTGWTYPACAGKPHLTGMTGPQAHLYILTGTADPAHADAHDSLVSPDAIAGLSAAGTEVFLEVGSHDRFGHYAHQVEYGAKLIAAGVPLEAEVHIRHGHALRIEREQTFGPAQLNHLWDALQVYVDPARAGERPQVRPGVSFDQVNRATQQLEPFTPADGVFPFTLEGARYVARGGRFPLVMVGAPGTEWVVTLAGNGMAPYVWRGTIADEMKSIQWVDVPPDQPLGDYAYGLTIRKPGSAMWQSIPSTSTRDGNPGVVTVVASEPNVGGPEVAGMIADTTGLSEY